MPHQIRATVHRERGVGTYVAIYVDARLREHWTWEGRDGRASRPAALREMHRRVASIARDELGGDAVAILPRR